jgi:GT2 family glycosyltransferase
MSRIGVVTVTYNSASVLDDFLRSVWNQTHSDFLLFIIDSASTDGTQTRMHEISDPRARTVLLEKNVGFAAGCNMGIKLALDAGCEAILLLNNDITFTPDLFQVLSDGLERYHCDMTTPKMLYFDPPNKIWTAGGHLNKWLGYRNAQDGQNQPDDGRFDVSRRVTFTPFCCIMMRSSVIRTLGNLDEKYFVYTEDNDYCFRALKANLLIWYLPEARLRHKVSSLTGGADTPFLVRYCTRNRIYFLHKNLHPSFAWPWTIAYLAYFFARRLVGKDTAATWRAKWQAVREGIHLNRPYLPS